MRPPEFWRADASGRDAGHALRALLTPLSWCYAWAAAERERRIAPKHAPVPVLCVGNLTVGGAGKTPLSRTLRHRLGPHAHTLSRGYGGRIAGPLRVTEDMEAREVGDEPLLHARDGPAWIAADRVAGARAAAAAGAHAIVMDDGFQNPTLHKDLSLLAVDAGYGIGNGQVFPAGPMREPLRRGLARADAVVLMHNGAPEADAARPAWLADFEKPVLHARIEPAGIAPDAELVAFAGLARPEKFFDTLAAMGVKLADAVPFADHHLYTDEEMVELAQLAADRGAQLITTEKDVVRLSRPWRERVAVLPVKARFSDAPALDALLAPILSRMSAAHG